MCGENLSNDTAQHRWWPVLGPIALAAVGASLITPAGRHQWALSIFRQRTPYTALSFNNPAALPTIAAANKPIPISFDIVNDEGRTINYRYVLSEWSAGKAKTLQMASKVVASGATWTVPTIVRPTCPDSPCRMEVSLPGHPETIDFLLTITS